VLVEVEMVPKLDGRRSASFGKLSHDAPTDFKLINGGVQASGVRRTSQEVGSLLERIEVIQGDQDDRGCLGPGNEDGVMV